MPTDPTPLSNPTPPSLPSSLPSPAPLSPAARAQRDQFLPALLSAQHAASVARRRTRRVLLSAAACLTLTGIILMARISAPTFAPPSPIPSVVSAPEPIITPPPAPRAPAPSSRLVIIRTTTPRLFPLTTTAPTRIVTLPPDPPGLARFAPRGTLRATPLSPAELSHFAAALNFSLYRIGDHPWQLVTANP